MPDPARPEEPPQGGQVSEKMEPSINADRERKYPVTTDDPIGSRAEDELMRVTGMGEYAERVQGGPPGKVRISIPAQREYDTDLVIGAALSERKALRKELDASLARVERLRGALERMLGDAVASRRKWVSMDEARAALSPGKEESK